MAGGKIGEPVTVSVRLDMTGPVNRQSTERGSSIVSLYRQRTWPCGEITSSITPPAADASG